MFYADIFTSTGYISKSGIAGLYGKYIFDFIRNCQAVASHTH